MPMGMLVTREEGEGKWGREGGEETHDYAVNSYDFAEDDGN